MKSRRDRTRIPSKIYDEQIAEKQRTTEISGHQSCQAKHPIQDPFAGKGKHQENKIVQKLQKDVGMEDFPKILLSITVSISAFKNLL